MFRVALLIVAFFLLVQLFFMFQFFSLYVRAISAGVQVSVSGLMGMRLRKVDPRAVVNAAIEAKREGFWISLLELETHYLAGGNPSNVVNALILAKREGIDLPKRAAFMGDLARPGSDPLAIIEYHVNAPPELQRINADPDYAREVVRKMHEFPGDDAN